MEKRGHRAERKHIEFDRWDRHGIYEGERKINDTLRLEAPSLRWEENRFVSPNNIDPA
jgi:hypothetical protein